MKKTLRVDYSGGINVITDKTVIPDKFATALDNVDLRSGFPRAFKEPIYMDSTYTGTTQVIDGVTVPVVRNPEITNNTKKIFNFRGRWIYSDNWRDYVAQYIDGIETIYWSEEGQKPQKMVEGTQVPLGTPRPEAPPIISVSTNIRPSLSIPTFAAGGALKAGLYYYAVSAVFEDGISPPSNIGTAQIVPASGQTTISASVTLSWTSVVNAKGYIVWGREAEYANMQKLTMIDASVLTFVDTGLTTPTGDNAGQYMDETPVRYVYTYERNVKGVINESGISSISLNASTIFGRKVTRDYLNDGFFDQPSTQTITDANSYQISVTPTINQYSSIRIIGITYNLFSKSAIFTTSTNHNLLTDQQIALSGDDWSNIGAAYTLAVKDKTMYKIIKISATSFAIKNIAEPVLFSYSASPTPPSTQGWNLFIYPARTRISITPAPSQLPTDGCAIYLDITSNGGGKIKGLFYVSLKTPTGTAISPEGSFDINTFTTAWSGGTQVGQTAKYVPNDGYYKYWNVYRTGIGNAFQLVKRVPVKDASFDDVVSTADLGQTPASYYVDTSIFGGITVDYNTPPLGLQSLTSHLGMMFGVDGHTVRWTPINAPDAWPYDFRYNLPYKPLALASFGSGLIILCEDAIYRIDGGKPAGLSLNKTQAEDGCVAPYSVQKTSYGLIYLSHRGLMVFNGTHAKPLTDTRVRPKTLLGPSNYVEKGKITDVSVLTVTGTQTLGGYTNVSLTGGSGTGAKCSVTVEVVSNVQRTAVFITNGGSGYQSTDTLTATGGFGTITVSPKISINSPVNFWWIPSTLGYFYANFADQDTVLYSEKNVPHFSNTQPIPYPIYDIKSFYHVGKYFIYWPNSEYYEGHTTMCIDLETPNVAITTLGMKADDVIVNEVGEAYALFSNQGDPSQNNLIYYKTQQSTYGPQNGFATNSGKSVWKLFSGNGNMPLMIRTGSKSLESISERKAFHHIELYGNGTISIRVYIDGRWVADDVVTLAEGPTKPRRMNLPRGNRIGYTIDLEIYGDTNRLLTEIEYDDMTSPS